MNPDIDDFAARLREFARERDWEQFHAPKNLASALVVEAGELLEHFQWMPEEQSRQLGPEKKQAVEEEVADVFLYLVRFADVLDIDIAQAALRKLERNAARYPVALARGSSRKAGELGS
jgi:NTP pyrophosphatase (non-canonical NTP hydrolase)